MSADLIPPRELIISSGIGAKDREHLEDEYQRIGEGIFGSLKTSGGLTPDSRVLEVGCGLARIARPMIGFFDSGSYTGLDVNRESIDWCNAHYAEFPEFRFLHMDVFNTRYNPDGPAQPHEYRLPVDDACYDLVFSSSLFTHLLIDTVDNYLGEFARVLKPGSYTWNTFLLLDEHSEPKVLEDRTDGRKMLHRVDGGRVANPAVPEQVVGLYLDRVEDLHRKHGLEIVDVKLTNWSGGRPDIAFAGQDLIVARKGG